jgi:AcrR family transcriptional regulator
MAERPTRPRLDPAVHVEFRRRAITAAMAELCAERGLRATTVTEVAARSATGRGTVYSLYPNREAIFLDLIERVGAELLALAKAACGGAGVDPRERVGSALRAILARLAEEPAGAHVLLVEAPCTSAESLLRYQTTISGLAALLGTAMPETEASSQRLEEIIVGGLAAVLARRVREGRLAEAPALLEDFVGLALAPYARRNQGLGPGDHASAASSRRDRA